MNKDKTILHNPDLGRSFDYMHISWRFVSEKLRTNHLFIHHYIVLPEQ